MHTNIYTCLLVFLGVACSGALPTRAQELSARASRIALFLDCGPCDDAHIRREMTFVDHVRDREVADVHMLVTVEATGSGGRAYIFHAIGLGQFEGQRHEVTYSSPPAATEDDERGGIVRMLKVALVPFLMQTPAANRLSVEMEASAEANYGQIDDPWKGWTIELYGDGFGDMESNQYSFH